MAQSQIAHQADVVEANLEAAKHGDIIYGSIGALVLAVLSFVLEHRIVLLLLPLAACIGAILSLAIPLLFTEVRKALGWKLIPHFLMAIAALVIVAPALLTAWRDYR